MKIGGMYSYNEGESMIYHYALGELYDEIKDIIFSCELRLVPEKNVNGVEPVKIMLSKEFEKRGWKKEVPIELETGKTTNMDFLKVHYNGYGVGIEVQFGYESRIHNDFLRVQRAIQLGVCKVGILIVPIRDTAIYLSDRVASFEACIRQLKGFGEKAFPDLKIVVIGIYHDGTTDIPLKKQKVGRKAQKKKS